MNLGPEKARSSTDYTMLKLMIRQMYIGDAPKEDPSRAMDV